MINAFTVSSFNTFRDMFGQMRDHLLDTDPVDVGEWQSQKLEMPMRELLHVTFDMNLPDTAEELAEQTGARLPWAEDHFQERVGGEPLNPSPSEAWWPFRQKKDGNTNTDHKSEGEAFSHTYPERMWPKLANVPWEVIDEAPWGQQRMGPEYINRGIRFDYGDLGDIIEQLKRSPNTRQAYLPIWFPEDTGAVHGKRVPCTLGYHFIIRNGQLDISYFMRSTDLLRHFQDDIYLAGRLAQWVVDQVNFANDINDNPNSQYLAVGKLIFHTANLHIFEGDVEVFNFWKSQGKTWY